MHICLYKIACTSKNCANCYDDTCTVCMESEMYINNDNDCITYCNKSEGYYISETNG